VEAGAFEGVSAWWLNPWTVFDSKYFLHIARAGYSGEGAPEAAGFFPLYPALLQPLAHDENAAAALGIVLSNAFLLAACWILLRLTQREYAVRHGGAGTQADGVARRAVFGLAFFPVSAYFSAVYSESLFLLCSVCLFWCARRDKWAWVAAWGLAAGATRNGGPLLSLALLAVVASQCRAQVLAPRARRNLAAPIVASLVPLATLLVIQRGLASAWAACCLRRRRRAASGAPGTGRGRRCATKCCIWRANPDMVRRAQPERSFGRPQSWRSGRCARTGRARRCARPCTARFCTAA
jgi:hypothetical protein